MPLYKASCVGSKDLNTGLHTCPESTLLDETYTHSSPSYSYPSKSTVSREKVLEEALFEHHFNTENHLELGGSTPRLSPVGYDKTLLP